MTTTTCLRIEVFTLNVFEQNQLRVSRTRTFIIQIIHLNKAATT